MNKTFIVLQPFVLLRTGEGSKLADEHTQAVSQQLGFSMPLLGQYHQGHEYYITEINTQGVAEAIEKGFAK